jgi:hypothetical protein
MAGGSDDVAIRHQASSLTCPRPSPLVTKVASHSGRIVVGAEAADLGLANGMTIAPSAGLPRLHHHVQEIGALRQALCLSGRLLSDEGIDGWFLRGRQMSSVM